MISIGGVIILSVAAVATATIVGVGMANAAERSAEAQEAVAQTNARATVEAAKEAANAQVQSATQDAQARMHDADMAHQQEQEYLQFEKWAMTHEDDLDNYYRTVQNDIDAIDTFYAEGSSWGTGTSEPYDYGNGGDTINL